MEIQEMAKKLIQLADLGNNKAVILIATEIINKAVVNEQARYSEAIQKIRNEQSSVPEN